VKHLVLVVLLVAALAACGGGSHKTVAIRLTSPLVSNVYIELSGPAAAVDATAGLIRTHLNQNASRNFSGAIMAPAAHGQVDCSHTREIRPDAAAAIRKYAGQKLQITVRGTSSYAAGICQGLEQSLK
jgi:hypothetical protein